MKRKQVVSDYADLDNWCAQASDLQWRLSNWIQQDNMSTNRMFGMIKNQLWKAKRKELGLPSNAILPKLEQEPVRKRAKSILEAILAGKQLSNEDSSDIEIIETDMEVLRKSRELGLDQRESIEDKARKLATKFPNAKWLKLKDTNGFAELGLCVCVGASGNWDHYPGIRKLWKRLGKAPFEHKDITRACSSWRHFGGLPDTVWADHDNGPKYNPRRASTVFGYISSSLLRAQWRKANEKTGEPAHPIGPYGEKYGTYKARITALNEIGAYAAEAARLVTWAKSKGKKPKKENLEGKLTTKHIHNRAVTFMVKCLLKDAWRVWHATMDEWRRSIAPVKARAPMADATQGGVGPPTLC